MKKDDFEFETDNLTYFEVEHRICSKFGLRMPSSSNFIRLSENTDNELKISAANGRVECWVHVTPGSKMKYNVAVYCIDVIKTAL